VCGIAGVWDQVGRLAGIEELAARARAMAGVLAHRGPDDEGVWVDAEVRLALSHRRLAVIDLSPAGHQPMVSAGGRWVVTFNGEIYNCAELRRALAGLGHRFRGTSDTEVMLASFEQWGVLEGVERFVGMFAFAAWDRREGLLWLVRDRIGKKPLYWWAGGGLVAFASELKGLMAIPEVPRRLNRAVLARYLQFGFVSPPDAILEGARALAPGGWVCARAHGEFAAGRYWLAGGVIAEAKARPFRGTLAEAAEALEEILGDAVRLRMLADVPLGAFLSGGIDSSTITALMQRASGRPVRTFSMGFRETAYDESPHAAAVARHLGTEHTTLTVTEEDALQVVARLPEIFDEPFADSSQIPTYLVAREARRHVTVVLTGDGGDELLCGYERYPVVVRDWQRTMAVPYPLRWVLSTALTVMSSRRLAWALAPAGIFLRMQGKRYGSVGERVGRRAVLLGATSLAEYYDHHGHSCLNPQPIRWLRGPWRARQELETAAGHTPGLEPLEQLTALDFNRYLPDDILVKVDRASMAVALETRCPLLDHRVVEFAWRLPLTTKWDGRQGKVVLRRILSRYVPAALWTRPKMGFGMPVGEWLKGALREWAEDVLTPQRLGELALWRMETLRRAWREHLAGAHDHRNLLWPVLMFETWRRYWRVG